MQDEMIDVHSGFLTLDDLILAHGRIGSLMHANSPYREEGMLSEIEKEFSVRRAKLIRLLDNHIVRFPGNDAFLYVGMKVLKPERFMRRYSQKFQNKSDLGMQQLNSFLE